MMDYLQQRILDNLAKRQYNDTVNATPKHTPGPLFISFSGKKQVGKDTAYEICEELLRSSRCVGRTAFAKTLKDVAIDVIGLDEKHVYGSNKDKDTPTHVLWENFPREIRIKYSICQIDAYSDKDVPRSGPMTVREVLQVMGTDVFRKMFESDIWAKSPFRHSWCGHDVVFITDCRFPNEKEITERNGGVVIRIERDTDLKDDHLSETALDDAEFEYMYKNNGSIEDLTDFLRETLTKLKLL